jgi:hypothetical protein
VNVSGMDKQVHDTNKEETDLQFCSGNREVVMPMITEESCTEADLQRRKGRRVSRCCRRKGSPDGSKKRKDSLIDTCQRQWELRACFSADDSRPAIVFVDSE